MTDLKDKVALVTGGARGLGKATSWALAKAGAIVVLVDILDELDQTVTGLKQAGLKARGIIADVTEEEQIKKAVAEVDSDFGRVDILINNAGTDFTLPLTEMETRNWDKVMGVNLRAPFIFTKEVFPLMKKQNSGHIVNITSTAAKRAWANASAYHASKWGLLGFTHALGVEGRPYHIKATAIVTGGMKTPFLLDRFPDIDVSTLQDPKNVAHTIVHVLSLPVETAINELLICPINETSWP
ncbi:MAG: SDR family oxidoreductase [Patescibacteria group bacterium]|nr:SDR family oxidoreductase [Patescibacteria group bacterium]